MLCVVTANADGARPALCRGALSWWAALDADVISLHAPATALFR